MRFDYCKEQTDPNLPDFCIARGCPYPAYGNETMCFDHQTQWSQENDRPDWLPTTEIDEGPGDF